MIYLVHEWCDHEHNSYFIDTSKLDLTSPYELAYNYMLEIAHNEADKSLYLPEEPKLMKAIEPHFGSKEASDMVIRAHVDLPCMLEREVTLYFS